MSYGGNYGGGGGGGYAPPGGGPPPPGGRPGGGYGGPPPPGGGYGGPPPPGGPPGGGYGAPPPGPRPPPPGADPKLWHNYSSVDTDNSGSISAPELQKALYNGDWSPFDLDTVKLLMTIFDSDRSGTITFNEFSGLWKYIEDWQKVFTHFDRDRSGSIDGRELQDALRQFGYNLSPQLMHLVEAKYDLAASGVAAQGAAPGFRVPGQGGGSPGISFDRFVRACVAIKQLSEAFQKLDTDRDGWIQINYDQFMHTVLTLP